MPVAPVMNGTDNNSKYNSIGKHLKTGKDRGKWELSVLTAEILVAIFGFGVVFTVVLFIGVVAVSAFIVVFTVVLVMSLVGICIRRCIYCCPCY